MPKKKVEPEVSVNPNGVYSFAFQLAETEAEKERVECFLERLNDLTDGDIVTTTGKTAVVRTENLPVIRLLGKLKNAKRQARRDENGDSVFVFPMLGVADMEALEELIGAAKALLNIEQVTLEKGEIIVCQTRSKDLASVLGQYADKIPNGHADFGLE